MLTLTAKIRQDLGKKVKVLREKGVLPAVLYGWKLKETLPLELDYKNFQKVYEEAGESSLISLLVEREKFLVLVHEVACHPLTGKFLHVDFYQPNLEEEVEVDIPLVFEGEAPAVKEFGGTFIKNISEITVKSLPQNLPKELKVNIVGLKTFEDNILVKDLRLPEGVKILREQGDVIAQVIPPEKVEEILKKPIEEKVEEVEKVEEKKPAAAPVSAKSDLASTGKETSKSKEEK